MPAPGRPRAAPENSNQVRIEPGVTQHVTLTLDKRSLAYWDVTSNNWRVDPGRFTVFVGDSSENSPLTQDFTVQ